MQNSIVKTAIISLLIFVGFLTGCASYHTSSIKSFTGKTLQVDTLESNPPELGKIITDAIRNELAKKGVLIIKENADAKLTGSVLITPGGNWMVATKSWVSAVVIQMQDKNGEIILSSRFDQSSVPVSCWGEKTAAEIGTELGKKIAKKLK